MHWCFLSHLIFFQKHHSAAVLPAEVLKGQIDTVNIFQNTLWAHITYQQAFSRYFRNCDWEYEKDGSIKRVRFTGITADNENVDIVFNITDADDGFYYNVENIIVDGVRIENVLGDYGVGLAIEEIFESY